MGWAEERADEGALHIADLQRISWQRISCTEPKL